MPGSVEGNSPAYISGHSADVILSDIRPIKLKIEALKCINVLLDEFLYSILSTARSLATDKLRAGLLSVLPTTLGKEALLEAEVELRAYWDRTKRSKNAEDDSDSFSLQWAFELLRLKCEAYSTLNESDSDKDAENKLQERMAGSGQPPKAALVAPAALYLTAILEAMCEHILSNVGRVASRDSSRTYANVQDVFVALCEDESIYGLFKTMNVYQQIEQLSHAPKPRRSKSISRSDKLSMSRTSSVPHQDSLSRKDSPTPPPAHRLSLESSPNATPSMTTGRSSFDRAKSVKKLMNGRHSNDGSLNGHKRSESVLSDEAKQTWAAFSEYEDEFDDLMKSDSTMKVSLTPDRLKTMEVYKQEKDQRVTQSKPAPFLLGNSDSDSSASTLPPRATNRRPVPLVDSTIKEDEEEAPSKPIANPRARQSSVTSPPKSLPSSNVVGRMRAHSAAGASNKISRKPSRTKVVSPSSLVPPPVPAAQTRDFRSTNPFDGDGLPQKTRRIQHNRESMDLDDIMAGSDDEEDEVVYPAAKGPSTPVRRPAAKSVSASTRELMDFLNEGPPDVPSQPPLSKAGRELAAFLAEGPPDTGFSPVASFDNGKPKGSGRLQRMISKLSLGGSEKTRQAQAQNHMQDDIMRRGPPSTPNSIRPPPLSMKTSASSLSALANRPIPPRPPLAQMISPPSSPSQGSVDLPPATSPVSSPSANRQRQPSVGQFSISRKVPVWDQEAAASTTSIPPPPAAKPVHNTAAHQNEASTVPAPTTDNKDRVKTIEEEKSTDNHKASISQNGVPQVVLSDKPVKSPSEPLVAKKLSSRASPPSIQTERKTSSVAVPSTLSPTSAGGISANDAQDMRRLLLKATSPDECRLILDMFLAKSGIPVEPADDDVPYPSPSPSDAADTRPSTTDNALEISLVELFLGGEISHEPAPRKKKYSSKRIVDTSTISQPILANAKATAVPTSTSTAAAVAEDATGA